MHNAAQRRRFSVKMKDGEMMRIEMMRIHYTLCSYILYSCTVRVHNKQI
jgi:hypothetical protein